jgi:Cobalamin-independent synthase, N-terminal domain
MLQIHEPVLAAAKAGTLRSDAEATYAALAAAGVPISLVIPYDDVSEEVYTWLVELPVAAISLDFCGVPGAAAGNGTAQLIAKYGFPKVSNLPSSYKLSVFTLIISLLTNVYGSLLMIIWFVFYSFTSLSAE